MDGLLAWFNSGIVKELKEQVTAIEAKKDRGEYDDFEDSIKLVELITILYWIHVFLFTMESVDEELKSFVFIRTRIGDHDDFLPFSNTNYFY